LTGEAAAPIALRAGSGGRLAEHPEKARLFDSAMLGKIQVHIPAILSAYDFSPFREVANIGGAGSTDVRKFGPLRPIRVIGI
jgi:hypothetical protein